MAEIEFNPGLIPESTLLTTMQFGPGQDYISLAALIGGIW